MGRAPKADGLRYVLDPRRGSVGPWMPHELGMIFDHQLDSRIPVDDTDARVAVDRGDCACSSLRQFSTCNARQCGSLTRRFKEAAKDLVESDPDYPRDVARILYLLAVLRAKRTGMVGVTSMTDDGARREIRRVLAFGWISDDARRLLRDCGAFLTCTPR